MTSRRAHEFDTGSTRERHLEERTRRLLEGRELVDDEGELDTEIVVVGAGFGGIGAAIELLKFGFRDFLILEEAEEVGGTWRDNTYPGLAVDVPSTSYSFSFEPNPNWSRVYAPGAELQAYAEHCVNAYGLRSHIRFGVHVSRAVFDAARNSWTLHLSSGDQTTCRFLVAATGFLVLPKLPEIDGIESFSGKTLHSARWDHEYDLRGKKVAVIGTGATAIQLIPAIADQVSTLDVYQRTPIWLMPKPDYEIPSWLRSVFRRAPFVQKTLRVLTAGSGDVLLGLAFLRHRSHPWIFRWVERKLRDYIKSQVEDPELQDKLTPRYSFFCKRPSFSNEYFSVFNRPNVELITDPIDRIDDSGILTADGRRRDVDALVCATGYEVFNRRCPPTFEVLGLDGKNLGDFWAANRFQAFMGATVPSFPNFFLIFGPYASPGVSYFDMINTQARHLARCLKAARAKGADYIEVRQAAHDRDFAKVLRRGKSTVFFSGDCAGSNSFYFDGHGDVPSLRPYSYTAAWLRSRTFSMRNYRFESEARSP